MNGIGRLACASLLLLVVSDVLAVHVPVLAQQIEEQPALAGQSQPSQLQQTQIVPPFSPLFGPYTAPPAIGVTGEPGGPTQFMRKGGRAQVPPQTERFVLTPSILVDEAYTDNVFLDNDFKRSDFITSFTPGLLFGVRTPDFALGLGYVFTSEIYAKETQLNDALARWAVSVATYYTLTPQLRIDLDAAYLEDNNTTASGIAGVSTGRTRSRGATVSPALTWQFDPATLIQLRAAWYTQTFDQNELLDIPLSSYDTYTFSPTIRRRITPTLTGTFSYQYLFSDVDNGQDVEYHLILPGVEYRIMPDLAVALSLGPQIVTQGQTGTTLAAQFALTKSFLWGAVGLTASRGETADGGLGGSSETNTVGLSATITNLLLRGLTLNIAPSYTNSSGSGSLGTTDSINLQVLATYPITRWLAAFLAYNYFRQRTTGTTLNDIDANRVTAGIQLFQALRLR